MEHLGSSCNGIQAEESANTLKIKSISKSDNSAKLSIVIVSSTEASSAN